MRQRELSPAAAPGRGGRAGTIEIAVPRARIKGEDGKAAERKSQSPQACPRRTPSPASGIGARRTPGAIWWDTRMPERALPEGRADVPALLSLPKGWRA